MEYINIIAYIIILWWMIKDKRSEASSEMPNFSAFPDVSDKLSKGITIIPYW